MKVDFKSICFVFFFLICIASSSVDRSADSSPNNQYRGISPQDEKYYKSSGSIKCRDNSKVFTKAQLNDEFCDCPDGTDEPGTSACPKGKFYCQNAGHTPLLLYSSRVNDGICDCCDGSDEYDGKVKCPNTCWEAGKVARDKLMKKISTFKEGVTLRKQEIEQAKLAIAKDEEELSKLKTEEKILKPLVQQLKDRKEQIEKEEEKERLEKEKQEKEKQEAEEKQEKEKQEAEERANKEKSKDENAEVMTTDSEAKSEITETEEPADSDDNPMENAIHEKVGVLDDPMLDQVEDVAEIEEEDDALNNKVDAAVELDSGHDDGSKGNVEPENMEGLSKEEVGRLVASRWTRDTEKHDEEVDGSKYDDHEDHEDMPKDTDGDESDGYASETDEDTGKYDDNSVEDNNDETYKDEDHDDSTTTYEHRSDDESESSDTLTLSNPSWLEKIQKTVRNILQAVNPFQTPIDKSDAARVRSEYDDSSAKLSKIQSRISSLNKKLKHDFGPEKEFYSLYGRCFEFKQNKYVYKACPFKEASQVEGHSTTRLGRWDKFDELFKVMVFSEGEKCWNGPDRSLKIRLRCGLKNEITDVEEPSRCEYAALMSTTALCLEDKLKELQRKLDLMQNEQPQVHDEF